MIGAFNYAQGPKTLICSPYPPISLNYLTKKSWPRIEVGVAHTLVLYPTYFAGCDFHMLFVLFWIKINNIFVRSSLVFHRSRVIKSLKFVASLDLFCLVYLNKLFSSKYLSKPEQTILLNIFCYFYYLAFFPNSR